MLKRQIIIPIVLVLLGIAFVIVSFLVNITRGNAKLLKNKLRLGGLIITLTALLNNPVWAQQGPDVLCYKMPATTTTIEIHNSQNQDEIFLELPYDNVITGVIHENTSEFYSFKIKDAQGQVVQIGELVPYDGAFNQQTEEFELNVDSNLPDGKYNLYIYEYNLETIKQNLDMAYLFVYVLTVVDVQTMCYDMQIID